MKGLTVIKEVASKGKYFAKAHSPQLLLAGGFVAGAVGIAMVIRGTVKAVPVVDEAKAKIDLCENKDTEGFQTFFDAQNKARELAGMEPIDLGELGSKKKIIVGMVGNVAKCYALSLGFFAVSALCFASSYKVLNARYAGAVANATGLAAAFKKYRGRVVEKFGEEVDKELYYGDNVKKVKKVDPETGNEYEEIVPNVEKGMPWYSTYSFRYENESYHPGFDVMQLENDQNYWNMKLDAIGYIEANDILSSMPGHKGERRGDWCGCGWISRKWIERLQDLGVLPEDYAGDGHISFGIFDGEGGPQAKEWIDGNSREVMIDLNVDGPIYKFINAINNYEDLVAKKCGK